MCCARAGRSRWGVWKGRGGKREGARGAGGVRKDFRRPGGTPKAVRSAGGQGISRRR